MFRVVLMQGHFCPGASWMAGVVQFDGHSACYILGSLLHGREDKCVFQGCQLHASATQGAGLQVLSDLPALRKVACPANSYAQDVNGHGCSW